MKNKKIEYQCEKCGYAHIEKTTIKKEVLHILKLILTSAIIVLTIIGSTGLYNFIAGEIYENPDIVISTGGILAAMESIKSTFRSDGLEELKEISINLTKGCEDDYCKAKQIYAHLLTFDYESGSNTNPIDIWKDKKGDCDEMSSLYIALLKSSGINSMLQCTSNHCYTIIKLEDMNILADLTKYEWEEFEK